MFFPRLRLTRHLQRQDTSEQPKKKKQTIALSLQFSKHFQRRFDIHSLLPTIICTVANQAHHARGTYQHRKSTSE